LQHCRNSSRGVGVRGAGGAFNEGTRRQHRCLRSTPAKGPDMKTLPLLTPVATLTGPSGKSASRTTTVQR